MHSRRVSLQRGLHLALAAILFAALLPTLSRTLAALDPRFDTSSLCRTAGGDPSDLPGKALHHCPYCTAELHSHALLNTKPASSTPPHGRPILTHRLAWHISGYAPERARARAPPSPV